MIIGVYCCTARELSGMHDKKSLMLHSRSCLAGGSDIVTGLCAHKGSQSGNYGGEPLRSPWIIQDVWRKIVEALVTHISRM